MKEEYIARYIDGNIGKATWSAVTVNRPLVKNHVPEDDGPLSPAVTSKLPPLDATPEEAAKLNYMFHRDDYDFVSFFYALFRFYSLLCCYHNMQ